MIPTDPSSPIGFIGLGVMGARMAARLVGAGHSVLAYDADARTTSAFADKGATAAASIDQIAQSCSVVFCSLPSPKVLETVVIGVDGLVGEGRAVRFIVDLSTSGPTVTQALSLQLADHGITLVDCPVSGGAPGAEAGTLTLMASGPRPVFDELEPLLRLIGSNIFYVGDKAGLAQTMKLVNNLLFAANAVSAFEVLTFGVKAGLDPQTMLDIINVSS